MIEPQRFPKAQPYTGWAFLRTPDAICELWYEAAPPCELQACFLRTMDDMMFIDAKLHSIRYLCLPVLQQYRNV